MDGPRSAASIAVMVAHWFRLFGMLALLTPVSTLAKAPARPRSLPPPAGDSRVGVRQARRADPAAVSAWRRPAPAQRPEAGVKLPEVKPERPESKTEHPEVKRAVDTASSLVGQRTIVVDGVDYGDDCAALVRAAFARAGRPLPSTAKDPASIHALASTRNALKPVARASPGDVVFLANRPGGPPAHVGIVERVDGNGKAIVLHRVARGVMRLRVSLTQPGRAMDASGRRLNDLLVVGAAPVTAGSLVVAFATFL